MKSPWKTKGARGLVVHEEEGWWLRGEEWPATTLHRVTAQGWFSHRVVRRCATWHFMRLCTARCVARTHTRRTLSARPRGWQRGRSNSERHQLGQYWRPCPSPAPLPLPAPKCSLAAPTERSSPASILRSIVSWKVYCAELGSGDSIASRITSLSRHDLLGNFKSFGSSLFWKVCLSVYLYIWARWGGWRMLLRVSMSCNKYRLAGGSWWSRWL